MLRRLGFLFITLLLTHCGDDPSLQPISGASLLPKWSGTRQLGVGGADTQGYGVATDANGNVFVVGYTTGDLDGNTMTGTQDSFVTKYNASGVKQWTQQLGDSGQVTCGIGVATDSSGNVFVGGNTNGGLDGNTLMGTSDYFVTKYNSSGAKQWTRQLGQSGKETYGIGVATDSSGNVFVGGYTTGGLDGNTLTGTVDLFVTKYNSSGVKQWTRQLGDSGKATWGIGVATDSSGNVFVGGYTMGNLDGNTVAGNNDFYFFVTKYDSSGVTQWTQQLGASGAITDLVVLRLRELDEKTSSLVLDLHLFNYGSTVISNGNITNIVDEHLVETLRAKRALHDVGE